MSFYLLFTLLRIYKILQPKAPTTDENGRAQFKIDVHEVALALVNHKAIELQQHFDLYAPSLIWYHISGGQCVYQSYQKDIRRQVDTLLLHLAHISHLMEIARYKVNDVPVLREWIRALVPIGELAEIELFMRCSIEYYGLILPLIMPNCGLT